VSYFGSGAAHQPEGVREGRGKEGRMKEKGGGRRKEEGGGRRRKEEVPQGVLSGHSVRFHGSKTFPGHDQ
jgi:hypothetical protein